MTKHMLASGLFAGFVVALLATLLQFAFLERNILLAERYEAGEVTHFAGVGHTHPATEHASPDPATAPEAPAAHTGHDHSAAAPAVEEPAAEPAGHVHAPADPDAPFWQRQVKTLLTMIITYCGYGLLLTAGLALAGQFGRPVTAAQGLLWGVAGFAAFSLAPAMGLAPELPGVEAADLTSRQVWWVLCAAATIAGLALMAYGKGVLPRLAALILLALPHIIGAPHLAEFSGILPPELAAEHAARSLGVGLVAWVALGGLAQFLWARE